MTQGLPSSPVPADCDLRDFAFMPLDVVRLRDSALAAESTGDEFRCAVLLWCASWHQIPAGSLPDNDVQLAQLAGFGRVVDVWRAHKAGAMRGWVKCADGRLYHSVIADKAAESWHKKLVYAWKKECDRIRKINKQREAEQQPTMPFPLEPVMHRPEFPLETANIPTEKIEIPEESKVIPSETGDGIGGIPAENALKGEGQGQGKGQGLLKEETTLSGKPDDIQPPKNAQPTKSQAIQVLEHLNKKTHSRYQPVDANVKPIMARMKEFSYEDCLAVIDCKVAQWQADDKMSEYLRPATLFSAKNFANYHGQLHKQSAKNGTGGDPRFAGIK